MYLPHLTILVLLSVLLYIYISLHYNLSYLPNGVLVDDWSCCSLSILV